MLNVSLLTKSVDFLIFFFLHSHARGQHYAHLGNKIEEASKLQKYNQN